jgi:hypothetical protein
MSRAWSSKADKLPAGFSSTSTAPACSASKALADPGPDRELKITTVHPGHLDIKRKHVRFELKDFVPGGIGIHRRSHNLDLGTACEAIGQGVTHQRGVINDHHSDSGIHG